MSSVESALLRSKRALSILCIAPFAPPVNHAEPIQVGRYLSELLRTDEVALVSERPTGSWSVVDPALAITAENLRRLDLALPLHSIASRLFSLNLWDRLPYRPRHWSMAHVRRIARWAGDVDIIYSRSMPPRAAVLAKKLRFLLRKPWIMHLSDPWADSPHLPRSTDRSREEADERACFLAADAISFTTAAVADFYRAKYPSRRERMFVSPNVFPPGAERAPLRRIRQGPLRLVYTGALYGNRQPNILIEAIEGLPVEWQGMVKLVIAGNATSQALETISRADPGVVEYRGHLSFADSAALQQGADLLVTLEDGNGHPLDGTFLLSKLLDYLPTGIPLLCLTTEGSVTQELVDKKYGWALPSKDRQAITDLLLRLLSGAAVKEMEGFSTDLPTELRAINAVAVLRDKMSQLVGLPC